MTRSPLRFIYHSVLLSTLLLCIIVATDLPAKSFDRGGKNGHEADMYAVLPFARSERISDWLELVHRTIDFPYNTYFPGLRDAPHQKFSWGKYGHRIFFHWGFNSEPWSPQIQEQVNKCNWDAKTVAAFKGKLIAEQARRNKAILEETGKLFGFGIAGQERGYANALASLVSDIHLLGDFTTENIAPLPNLQSVIRDLQTTLFERFRGGEEAKRINKLLDALEKQYPDTKKRARAALDLLKKEVPTFLLTCNNGYFKQHFNRHTSSEISGNPHNRPRK